MEGHLLTPTVVAAQRQNAVALAFDLMSLDGEDFRQEPYFERKAVLHKILRRTRRGIQYVEHAQDHGERLFEAVCELGLEGIVSKRLDAPYRSGPSKTWIKSKSLKRPALFYLAQSWRNDADGWPACCARATSGHAAALPKAPRNSRRLTVTRR
jgi:ATP-dependent DNA ligase